jgi:hypothetical protein
MQPPSDVASTRRVAGLGSGTRSPSCPRDTIWRASARHHRRTLLGCLWRYGGWIGASDAAPCPPLNGRPSRPVSAYTSRASRDLLDRGREILMPRELTGPRPLGGVPGPGNAAAGIQAADRFPRETPPPSSRRTPVPGPQGIQPDVRIGPLGPKVGYGAREVSRDRRSSGRGCRARSVVGHRNERARYP